jgi:hypothetical protein
MTNYPPLNFCLLDLLFDYYFLFLAAKSHVQKFVHHVRKNALISANIQNALRNVENLVFHAR